MQMICDGLITKNDMLQDSVVQYQQVYIKARRQFDVVVEVRVKF
jgi:DNA topoisomerase-3